MAATLTATKRDLKTAQKALCEIYVILKAINSVDMDHEKMFFEMGRAMGTASHGLTMSGHLEHPTKGIR